MSILSKLLGRRTEKVQRVKTTFDAPFRIPTPIIGFACVTPSQVPLMEADRAALGSLFYECRSSTTAIPRCHVLFLYCHVEPDGSLPNVKTSLPDLIAASDACIAVLASENDAKSCFAALKPTNDWPVNIVLILNRKGDRFALFFHQLFEAMLGGTSMLMEWVKLAPQMPGLEHPDCPVSILLPGAGHLTLDGRG